MTITDRRAAVFPVPFGYALACPLCNKYKMSIARLGKIYGFQCRDPKCGHFMAKLTAEVFLGMEMVEE